MKKISLSDIGFSILIFCGLLNLAFNITNTIKQDDKPVTLEEYKKKIANKDKVVLVYFSANWCTVCGKMKPILEGVEKDFAKKMDVIKIDTERDKEITLEFDVDALPAFILYKKGCVEWTYVGLLENRALRDRIEPFL
ncbi:MAG: thioredoxin family protein [Bacteroidia bacterium]